MTNHSTGGPAVGRLDPSCRDGQKAPTRQIDADRRREALRAMMKSEGIDAATLARRTGMRSANAVYNFLNGISKSLSQSNVERILRAFPAWTADALVGRTTGPQQPQRPSTGAPAGYQFVPLTAEAKAGCFRDSFQLPASERRMFLIPEEFALPKNGTIGVKVATPGAEGLYPAGSVLACRVLPDSTEPLTPGSCVIVTREVRARVETTVRTVVRHGGQLWLWPDSTSPDCQVPLLAPSTDSRGEPRSPGDLVSVVAIVMASWQPEPVPT